MTVLDLDAIEARIAAAKRGSWKSEIQAARHDAEDLLAEVRRFQAGDAAVRALHGPEGENRWCNYCGEEIPCMTIRALAAGGVA